MRPDRLAIGLTGGIGSGKSTVAAMFVARGATLVDTDAIARSLTAPGGAANAEIARAFGAEMLLPDGALDRQRMRTLAFNDPRSKVRLESILHPMIGAEASRQAHASAASAIVFDVPLLAESPAWRTRVHRVLVIDCIEATQIARVAARPGWDADSAARVVAQQAPRHARRAVSDAVIHNDGVPLQALEDAVASLWSRWVTKPLAS